MSGPYLTAREQAAQVAAAHGLRQESPSDVDTVYGRWASTEVTLSVTWHERGWTAAVEGRLPTGGRAGIWRSGHRPALGALSRHVAAAIEDFRAEQAHAA